jgi:pseudaminic acid biosynthesis-associated methylase
MAFNSPQEQFWAQEYARDYIVRNSSFDHAVGAVAWQRMLARAQRPIRNFLECGCNIGRNLHQLALALPEAAPSVIEISTPAFEVVTAEHSLVHAYNGAILDAPLPEQGFDLVFTMGVLIHIHPDQLLRHMARMHQLSSRYVLMGEYFNDTPTQIEYRGQSDRLFKRDFGKLFQDNFDVQVVDYGFLWSTELGAGGFDNITWWMFEKREALAGHA